MTVASPSMGITHTCVVCSLDAYIHCRGERRGVGRGPVQSQAPLGTPERIARRILTLPMALKLPVVLVLVLSAAAPHDEWSRFRGPNGSGISTAKDLPTEFGPDKNLVWKLDLP